MYYNTLRKQVEAAAKLRAARNADRVNILDCIAECYRTLHSDVIQGQHSEYNLPGGRGSCKSSFVSLEIVDGMMKDSMANAMVIRKTAATIRESVFEQIQWAIDTLGVSELWKSNVNPLSFTYLPTGQKILFRGLDDTNKLKSLKLRKGFFKYLWFEEFQELAGENTVRSVKQSVIRGAGGNVRTFNTFNPPLSINNWANKYVLQNDPRALTFRTDYTMIPPEWLGLEFIAEAERLRSTNERAYRHEYMGEAVGSGGEVFPNITEREITEEEIDQLQYFYYGLDWGFSVDPFAFVRCAYDRRTDTIFLLDEEYKTGCSNSRIAEIIQGKDYTSQSKVYRDIFGQRFEDHAFTITADSAEPKSIADLRDAGLKVIACKKYAGSVQYGIRWLQNRNIVIDSRRTPNAYREFSTYEYVTTKDGVFLADVPDRDNHTIDAVRYAFDSLINRKGVSA